MAYESCPPVVYLVRFLNQQGDLVPRTELGLHVDSCQLCQQALAELTRGHAYGLSVLGRVLLYNAAKIHSLAAIAAAVEARRKGPRAASVDPVAGRVVQARSPGRALHGRGRATPGPGHVGPAPAAAGTGSGRGRFTGRGAGNPTASLTPVGATRHFDSHTM
jgi:hypothetical protein